MLDEEFYGSKEEEPAGGKDGEKLGSVRRRSRAVAMGRIWVAAGRKGRNRTAVMVRSSWMTVSRKKRIRQRQGGGGAM